MRSTLRRVDWQGGICQWHFTEHVVGGPGAFLMKANGYEDFGRAFRQKFVTEVSAAD